MAEGKNKELFFIASYGKYKSFHELWQGFTVVKEALVVPDDNG